MRRRKRKAEKVDPRSLLAGHDPRSMRGMMAAYLEWMAIRGYTEQSVETRAVVLHYLASWCEERGITKATEVTRPVLQRYQRWLFYYRKKNGRPLGTSTQYMRLVGVTNFFRWATRQNLLLSNPASELELPRTEKRLPKAILTAQEVEKVLAQPDLRDPLGVRDRAILEVLYSTGMRRSEVVALSIFDIDQERGTAMVRQGKGKKDRLIPVGQRALLWVEKYVTEARPTLVMEPDEGVLFLSADGGPLWPMYLGDRVRGYVDAADLGKRGSCHLFRHTMATLMLEGGADIRFIQQMLGHASLESTQLYTRVSIAKLKQIHTATHPAATMGREAGREEGGAGERAELLARLDVEGEGEPEA